MVCSPGRLAEVVEAFEEDALRRRRRVCYFGAEEPLAGVLRARGPSSSPRGSLRCPAGGSGRVTPRTSRSRPPWPVRLLLATVRRWGRRFYDFDGLEAFKAKFVPDRWEPVYAVAGECRIGLRTLYVIAGAFGGGSPVKFLGRAALRRLPSARRHSPSVTE